MKKYSCIVVLVFLNVFATLTITGCKDKGDNNDYNLEEKLRNTIVTYMEEPWFSGQDIYQQLSGTPARFQLHNLDERKLYFLVPKTELNDQIVEQLTLNPSAVEFGSDKPQGVELGNYRVNLSNMLLRFPTSDLRVDPRWIIRQNYSNGISYELSMTELIDFLNDKVVYGGTTVTDLAAQDRYGDVKVFANHGSMIAMRGEPSLSRLVASIVKETDSKEVQAQKILDFVTMSLKYNYDEARAEFETLKRPNEVLITGGSDCGGLVIAFASLLEQTSIDYRLLYCFSSSQSSHLTVAVAGEFDSSNGYVYELDGATFHLAESTARGFTIGRTRLKHRISRKDISYIQNPHNGTISDARNGKIILWNGWMKI